MISKINSTEKTILPTPVHWKYHVLIWTFYTLFWHIVQSREPWSGQSLSISVAYTLANVAIAYFNVFYLMPRFLNQKRVVAYVLCIMVSFFLVSGLLILAISFLFWCYGFTNSAELFRNKAMIASVFGSNLSAVLVTMIIQLIRQRVAMQRQQQQLEKLQLTTELNFLKSQLNPHFLFNALNSIYFLIKKDPDTAAEALAGFSDLLRYQLYQMEGDMIPLQSELENLEKYIQLAALRKSDDLKVNTDFLKGIDNQEITPLLLLPLVENAFKHVASGKSEIKISAAVMDSILYFKISNPYEENLAITTVKEAGGIGLKNIKRRLDLLYAGSYEMEIKKEDQKFMVDLKLDLTNKKRP